MLLDVGANVNARTVTARTPLHSACGSGKARLVQLLVARDAAVSVVDRDFQSPLHHATLNGEPTLESQQAQCDIAACLVRAGANPALHDAQQRTPLDLATGEPIRKYLRALAAAPNTPPPVLTQADVGPANPTLAAINARPVALAVALSDQPSAPLVAPLSPAAMRKATSTLFEENASSAATPKAASFIAPLSPSAVRKATLYDEPAKSPLSPVAARKALTTNYEEPSAVARRSALPPDESLAPKRGPAAVASPRLARDPPLSPKAPRGPAIAPAAAAASPRLQPARAPPAVPAAVPVRGPPRALSPGPRVAPKAAEPSLPKGTSSDQVSRNRTLPPSTAAPPASAPATGQNPSRAATLSPTVAKSGRPLPTPAAASARRGSNAPSPAAATTLPAAAATLPTVVAAEPEETFSSDALLKAAPILYETALGPRPDVVYEQLLPDHLRVDVQYEESERVSPKDLVRESDNALQLEFFEASDSDRFAADAAAAAPLKVVSSREDRAAAQQAQLELVMKAKREMEEARKSIFILEKMRRERSVYQIDEAQRKKSADGAALSARSRSPPARAQAPLAPVDNKKGAEGAALSARSRSPPARAQPPLASSVDSSSSSSTTTTRMSPTLPQRALALSSPAASADDRPVSPRLPTKQVPSKAPPPPSLPNNVDPFSSIRGTPIIPAHVSEMIAEDVSLLRNSRIHNDDNDDDNDDDPPPPPPPGDANEPERLSPRSAPVIMCKKCLVAQATARIVLNAPNVECCKPCAMALKQAEMRAPGGRPPCEQCGERPCSAIVTLTGIRGVRDTIASMCKPCAVHWLSRVPRTSETKK